MSDQYNSSWTGAQIDEAVQKVRGDGVVLTTEQTLTDEQKAQARANIGAAAEGSGGGSAEGAVLYTEQALTEEQQTQARTNIGAVKSWNELADKPVVIEGTPDTLTWDGDTTGRVNLAGVFFKVSDVVPTKEDFADGCTLGMALSIGETGTFPIDAASAQSWFADDGFAEMEDGLIYIVPTDNYTFADGFVFPEKGVYFMGIIEGESYYIYSLTINGYTGFSTEVIKFQNLPESARVRRKYLYGKITNGVLYLYSRPVDATYEINRMTKAQLQEIFENYDALYLYNEGTSTNGEVFEQYYAVSSIGLFETYGAIHVNGVGSLYTAEYTAS